jgi:hypothetical protein
MDPARGILRNADAVIERAALTDDPVYKLHMGLQRVAAVLPAMLGYSGVAGGSGIDHCGVIGQGWANLNRLLSRWRHAVKALPLNILDLGTCQPRIR